MTATIILTSFIGCEKRDFGTSITCIKETNIIEDEFLSSVFSEYKIVGLETIDESMIGQEIEKIKKKDGLYFISCDRESLFVFNEQGEFLFRIKEKGAGPNEYISLQDFDVLPNGEILVLDMQKLIHYSATGEFLKTIPLDINCWNIKIIDEHHFLICASRAEYCLYLVDGEGCVLSEQLPKNNLSFLRRSLTFFPLGDNILYQQDSSNDFVAFNPKTKNFENVNLLCEDDHILDIQTVRQHQKTNPTFMSADYIEKTNLKVIMGISAYADFLFFYVGKQSTGYKYYLMNTKNNEITNTLSENAKDDIAFTSTVFLLNRSIFSESEDCLLTYLWPYQIIEGLEKNAHLKEHPNYKRLQTLIESIDDIEEKNPFLIELKK